MKLKKVLSLILCVAMVLGTMSFAVSAEAIDVSKAVDGVITLEAGTYSWSNALAGQTLTLKAAENADVVLEMGNSKPNLNGANITFEGITFNWGTNGYKGLQHAGNLEYKNCVINGLVFLYGASETFEGCKFIQTSKDYSVWTYSAKKVVFNNCDFENNGKAVFIYNEGAEVDSVDFIDCDFISGAAQSDKAAIEIGTTIFGKDIAVDITNCKIEGAGYGSETLSGSALVNQKDGDEAAVKVDGEYVTGAYVTDANGDKEYYSSVYEAIAAAPEGSTVDILGSVFYNPTRYPGTSKDTAWKRIRNKENITINGNGHTIKTDSVDTTSNDGALLSAASGITVNDLTVELPGKTDKEMPRFITLDSGELNNVTIKGGTFALSIVGDGEITINDCNFENIEGWAIETEGQAKTATLTIKDSTFDEKAVIFRSENNTFEGNTITGSGDGVNVLGNAVISGNDFGESSLGINQGVAVEIKNNVIETVELTTWYLPAGSEPDYSNVEIGSNKLGADAVATLKTIDETVESAELVAVVDGTDYYSMADALAAIKDGSEMTIYEGTYTESLKINKADVTVEANGEVKFTGAPSFTGLNYYVEGIDFEYNTGSWNIHGSGTIKDCNFKATNNAFRWGYTKGDITFDGCKIVAGVYALHFDDGAGSVILKDCEVSGFCGFGGGLTEAKFIGTKFYKDEASSYHHVNLWGDSSLEDCVFTPEFTVDTCSEDTVVTVDDCTVTDGSPVADRFGDVSKQDGELYIDGECVSRFIKIEDEYFASIKDAIDNAQPGVTIKLLGNITEKVVIEATGGATLVSNDDAVVIDLNGNTLNGYILIQDASKVIEIKDGNIVNEDSAESAVESVANVTLTNVNVTSARHAVNAEGGELTINGGNFTLIQKVVLTQNVVGVENAKATINGGVFVGPAGTTADSGAAVAAKEGADVTINGGYFSGGKNHTLSKKDTAVALTVNGGSFDQDVTAFVNTNIECVYRGGFDYPYTAEEKATQSIKITLPKVDGTDNLYNIVLHSDGKYDINEFVAAELVFENKSTTLSGATMKYEVSGLKANGTVAQKAIVDGREQYIINLTDGEKRLSGDGIIIGQIEFIGQGTIDFSVASGEVATTRTNTNLGRYYSSTDATLDLLDISAATIDGSIAEITRDVVVNVAYNHPLVKGKWTDDEITVTLKDYFGNVVSDDITDGVATFSGVSLGRITVTLEAPGFRKFVYNTTLDEADTALVLNFWNDVKVESDKEAIEAGATPVAHNFVVGDIVMDYIVDEYDLAAVTSYYGMYNIANNSKFLMYDLNRDGDIDIRDVQYVLHTMGN